MGVIKHVHANRGFLAPSREIAKLEPAPLNCLKIAKKNSEDNRVNNSMAETDQKPDINASEHVNIRVVAQVQHQHR